MGINEGEPAPPREPIPIEGSYILFDERQVAGFIGAVGVVPFMEGLRDEIEAVYREPGLTGAPRSNMLSTAEGKFGTMEVMTCSGPDYTVMKRIGSDPDRAAEGRPTVYGDMYVIEGGTGQTRLICGAVHLTAMRTAVTTALVLDRLKPGLETLSVVGTGVQGLSHAFAIAALSPEVRRIRLRDMDLSRARQGSERLRNALDMQLGGRATSIEVEAVPENDRSVERDSDAIVTATFGLPEQAPVLASSWLRPGNVIAAVGADTPGKRELDNQIYWQARFVTDELRQSLQEGELQHATAGLDIFSGYAKELDFSNYHGWMAGGRVIGITELLEDTDAFTDRHEPLTVYDSTGFSGQDLAAGRLMLRLLKESGYPQQLQFNAGPDISLARFLGITEQ